MAAVRGELYMREWGTNESASTREKRDASSRLRGVNARHVKSSSNLRRFRPFRNFDESIECRTQVLSRPE